MNKGPAPCSSRGSKARERTCKREKQHYILNTKVVTQYVRKPERKLHLVVWGKHKYYDVSWITLPASYLRSKCGSDDSVKGFDRHLLCDNVVLLKAIVLPRCLRFLLTMNGIEVRGSLGKTKPPTALCLPIPIEKNHLLYVKWSNLSKNSSFTCM